LHAGGSGGFDAEGGVLEDEAFLRDDAEALGGGDEGVWAGFPAAIILCADDDVEFIDDAEAGEGAGGDVPASAGGDGHGEFAMDAVDDFDDGFDRFNLVDGGEVEIFLAGGGFLDGEMVAVALVEDFDDAFGEDAAQFVKEGLGEVDVVILEGGAPSGVMERHGVPQGAVAIEDIGRKVALGYFDHE